MSFSWPSLPTHRELFWVIMFGLYGGGWLGVGGRIEGMKKGGDTG